MKERITKENYDQLAAELKELSGPRRKEIVLAIEYAKSLGDLSENAEYHIAREEQGKLEDRIRQIEHILKHAEIVERSRTDTIDIGATVVVKKQGETNTRTFEIVGSEETDMLSGKISYKSPIGTALSGKKAGDSITVTTPKGDIVYDIVSVK